MYEAFAQGREFTQLDIIAAIRATMPLSKTMSEQVTALRDLGSPAGSTSGFFCCRISTDGVLISLFPAPTGKGAS